MCFDKTQHKHELLLQLGLCLLVDKRNLNKIQVYFSLVYVRARQPGADVAVPQSSRTEILPSFSTIT